MTRKNRRDIERAVDELDGDRGNNESLSVVIRRDRVDEDGEIIETQSELVEL